MAFLCLFGYESLRISPQQKGNSTFSLFISAGFYLVLLISTSYYISNNKPTIEMSQDYKQVLIHTDRPEVIPLLEIEKKN